jgi:hypothetical protein
MRPHRRATWVAASLALAGALAGCGGAQPTDTPRPIATPVASLGVALAASERRITDALVAAGYQVAPPVVAYRPSEPASLTQVPRTVLQVQGLGNDSGYVVIYQLPSSAEAGVHAAELASYLGSGFGQTNFPVDAQFSVAQLDSTVAMTWWSRERAEDDEAAQGAYDVIRAIGQPYPVVK